MTAAGDGACSGNPGPGGWGALMRFEDGSVEEFGGYEPSTTNNRMELMAALKIFERLQSSSLHPNFTIRTDSKYLINGLNQWMPNWKKKGWRTASGKPVMNQDLWKALDNIRLKDVKLEYVKGHSGDIDNERVDKIAVSYSKGNSIELHSNQSEKFKEIISKQTDNDSNKFNNSVPLGLNQLLSRLDMVNHIAKNGYGLTLDELAELLDEPIENLMQKKNTWEWRDWLIEPMDKNRWRLRSSKRNSISSRERKDV